MVEARGIGRKTIAHSNPEVPSMPPAELENMELLAEVDALLEELERWIEKGPHWDPGRSSQALIRRLAGRADTLHVRISAPLVVATLGGTGTGKSSLVNALVGSEVALAGRERPTTLHPTLICHEDLSPSDLGIDPECVHLVQRNTQALRDLVLIDCPDPDTTEDAADAGTNLARLRRLLPYCDVLLITTTQQKYRSARVLEELADAAPGARLVFVQTHADIDEDIRDDWRRVLSEWYVPGEMYLVDSLEAAKNSQAGLQPTGDFARLIDLLTRSLSRATGNRIRRANFLDLVAETLSSCQGKIDAALPAVRALESSVAEQRVRLSSELARRMKDELLGSRRQWESRLLAEITSRWGFSPFSLLLRAYQGLGGLVTGAGLMRARSPAQMALWGAVEGGRVLARHRRRRHAEGGARRAVQWSLDDGELRTAAIIIDGYAAEAGCPIHESTPARLNREASDTGTAFVAAASKQLQTLIRGLADQHTGWFTRVRYEALLMAMLAVVMYRLGLNFFYDSWLAADKQPLLGVDFFLSASFWLLAWSALLVWSFTARLRRGLRAEIATVAESWSTPALIPTLFADVDAWCRKVRRWRDELVRTSERVAKLRADLAQPDARLGHRIG